ncbi:20500_t:CDS:2 [Gigaspora rosea]|nr:20500_t:CDS:2 [Gigaspora rosea]
MVDLNQDPEKLLDSNKESSPESKIKKGPTKPPVQNHLSSKLLHAIGVCRQVLDPEKI